MLSQHPYRIITDTMKSQDSQHLRELNFRVDASSVADAPWGATAFQTLQHPSESSHRCPDPLQPDGYTGAVRDERFPTVESAENYRQDEVKEYMPPSVENTAACGYPQDPRYDDMADYDMMTYDHPPPHGHRDRDVPDYTGVAQDDPTEAQANQPANGINTFDDAGQHAATGPAQAFLDEWLQQNPIPNGQATEYLQRIAIDYLHQPSLQVSFIHMEPSHAGGVKVVITLEMAGF